jgi:DNA-binding HxlR family transcriptional regulator
LQVKYTKLSLQNASINIYFCPVNKIKKRSDCPISSALDIFGDKWSLLIIRDIIFTGKKTYSEFSQSEEKIATNILASRLVMLEAAGIIVKEEHPESKLKNLYRLTKQGIELVPVLVEIILWSDKFLPISLQSKAFAKQLRKDKEGLINQIKAGLQAG